MPVSRTSSSGYRAPSSAFDHERQRALSPLRQSVDSPIEYQQDSPRPSVDRLSLKRKNADFVSASEAKRMNRKRDEHGSEHRSVSNNRVGERERPHERRESKADELIRIEAAERELKLRRQALVESGYKRTKRPLEDGSHVSEQRRRKPNAAPHNRRYRRRRRGPKQ